MESKRSSRVRFTSIRHAGKMKDEKKKQLKHRVRLYNLLFTIVRQRLFDSLYDKKCQIFYKYSRNVKISKTMAPSFSHNKYFEELSTSVLVFHSDYANFFPAIFLSRWWKFPVFNIFLSVVLKWTKELIKNIVNFLYLR